MGVDGELAGLVPPGLSLEAEAMFARRRHVQDAGQRLQLHGQDRGDELLGLRLIYAEPSYDPGEPRRSEPDRRGAYEVCETVRIFRK